MADEPVSAAPVASPAPAAPVESAAPAVEAPIAAPAAVPETPVAETPAVTETPVETGGSLLSDAKSAEPEAAPAPEGTDPKAAEAAPGEPKAEGEAPKPAEAQQAPLPTYPELTLPEGVTLDKDRVGEFDKLLGNFQNARGLDTETMQALRQDLVNYYISERQQDAERVSQMQHDVWNRTREGWKDEFRKDPDMGGNKEQTTIRQAGAAMERFGQVMGKQAESDLRMALRITGAGDHPAIIRFVQWASRYTTEQAKPVPATVPKAPQTNTRAARRYGGNQGA